MEPISPIAYFIKCKLMLATVTFSLTNGTDITGKVVDAFDSLVSLDLGSSLTFINVNQIVSLTIKVK